MNKCFECDNIATENHHVIPQSMGGKRTVPLCPKCHGLVHGITRNDNLAELIRRGIEKKNSRIAVEIFIVYQTIKIHEIESNLGISKFILDEFDYEIPVSRVLRIKKRIASLDQSYLEELFAGEFDEQLKYIWNEEANNHRNKLLDEMVADILSIQDINEKTEIELRDIVFQMLAKRNL